jgi:hypothetical protein
MRFTKLGDLEVVTRITGPTHPFLGMALAPTSASITPIVERVCLDRPQVEFEPFDAKRDLCRDVLTAVQEPNDRFGTHLGVTRIRYCADDQPIPSVYHGLAKALVEHVISRQARDASHQSNFQQTDMCHEPLTSEHVSHRD